MFASERERLCIGDFAIEKQNGTWQKAKYRFQNWAVKRRLPGVLQIADKSIGAGG